MKTVAYDVGECMSESARYIIIILPSFMLLMWIRIEFLWNQFTLYLILYLDSCVCVFCCVATNWIRKVFFIFSFVFDSLYDFFCLRFHSFSHLDFFLVCLCLCVYIYRILLGESFVGLSGTHTKVKFNFFYNPREQLIHVQ